jgi:hypothetical protein
LPLSPLFCADYVFSLLAIAAELIVRDPIFLWKTFST